MATNYDTGYAIAAAVQERAGIGTEKITDKTRRYVQRAYYELLTMEPWPFVMKATPGIINTVASVADDITATEGSATATITTSSATTDYTGYKIYHDTNQQVYRITDHDSYTLTIDATWKEDSVSAADCTIYQDEYSLAADCLRPWSFRDRTNDIPIEFDGYIYQHGERVQKSYYDEIVHVSMVGSSKVRFEPWLKSATTIEYIYTEVKSDLTFEPHPTSDTPVVPKWFRYVLEDMAYLKVLQDWEDRPSVQPKIASTRIDIARALGRLRDTYITNRESWSA